MDVATRKFACIERGSFVDSLGAFKPVALSAELVGSRAWLQLVVGVPLGLLAASVAGITQIAIGYGMNGASTWDEALATPWPGQPIGMVMQIVCAVLVMALVSRVIGRRPVYEFSADGALRELACGALLGASVIAGSVGVLFITGAYRVIDVSLGRGLVTGLLLGLGSAVGEEVVMRGILLRVLAFKIGAWQSLLLTAAGFGMLHLAAPGSTIQSAAGIALQAGILFGAAYLLTGRLWLAIGLHGAWNFAQTAVFGLRVSGVPTEPGLLVAELNGPAWLTGGAAGIEGSVVTIALGLMLSAALLAFASPMRKSQEHQIADG